LAEKIELEIVTPEQLLFSGEVDEVVVPGSQGYLGILPGHAPLLSELQIGVISYRQESQEDKVTVSRARKIQRFLSQPFFVAEQFTGIAGKYVPIQETIRSFREVAEGKYDEIPEQAFYMVGGIEEVLEKAEKMK